MRRLVFLVSVLFLAGCPVPQLTPEGGGVAVGGVAGPDCRFLGSVSASEGYNAQSPETNMVAVQASLRNKAAEMGGDHIVITSQQLGTSESASGPKAISFTTTGCPNCISMVASVYSCGARRAGDNMTKVTPSAEPRGGASGAKDKAKDEPKGFSRDAARAALDAAWASAESCKAPDGPSGPVTIKMTFVSSGDQVFLEIAEPEIASTPTGECILKKFRGARVPSFDGAAVTIARSFALNPSK